MSDIDRDFLSVHEAAVRFGVADKTVRRWLAEGLLKGVRFGRWGYWHIPITEIDRMSRVDDGAR